MADKKEFEKLADDALAARTNSLAEADRANFDYDYHRTLVTARLANLEALLLYGDFSQSVIVDRWPSSAVASP